MVWNILIYLWNKHWYDRKTGFQGGEWQAAEAQRGNQTVNGRWGLNLLSNPMGHKVLEIKQTLDLSKVIAEYNLVQMFHLEKCICMEGVLVHMGCYKKYHT